MPFLTRSLILYNGSDLTPAPNYTDDTDWPQTELAGTANLGEASAGSWLLRDEGGVIPDQQGTSALAGHNVVIVTVGSNTLFRGRLAASDQFRGRQKAGRAHELQITLEDQNSHLRGIVVHNWVRGAETDAARAQGLVASYLSGNPRATTVLNGSNYVVTGSNAVVLPAKTYSGVTPYEILRELANTTDKEMFVTIDNELAYFGHDYVGYASQIRISDDPANANSTTYAPWDPHGSVVSRDQLTALRSYYGTDVVQSSTRVTNTLATTLDYWEEVLWDSESVTAAEAATRALSTLSYRGLDEQDYTCAIGPMSGDEVYKIKPGHSIQFKSRAARAGRGPTGAYLGDVFLNTRVRELRWTFPGPDQYIAHVSLQRPQSGVRSGSQALATMPKPAPVAGAATTLRHWSFGVIHPADGSHPDPYSHDDETDTYESGCTAVTTYYPPADGCLGSGYGRARNGYSDISPIAPNTNYTITLDILWEFDPSVRHPSWGWYDSSNVLIGSFIDLATAASYAINSCYHLSSALLSPANATGGRFGWSAASFTYVDNLAIRADATGYTTNIVNYGPTYIPGVPNDNYIPAGSTIVPPNAIQVPYSPTSSGLVSTNVQAAIDEEDARIDSLIAQVGTVQKTLTNKSGLNIDWGDVVVQDTTTNDAFTVNTTSAYSGGWIGVAQQPIGSNASGSVLLSGYASVVNVGSNSTTRGHLLFGSNMARRAYGSATRGTGSFGQALTTSVAPDAIIWTTSDSSAGGGFTNPMTTAGDLIYGGAAGAATRLAVGASNTHLISDGVNPLWRPNTGGSLTDHDHTATGDGGDLTGGLISNYIDTTEQSSAPSSPASGKVRLFSSNTNFYQKDSGGVVTRLSGSGGSGSAVDWYQQVNESGASFANWTAISGTWDSDGTVIRHLTPNDNWQYADFNTLFPLGYPLIAEAEIKFPTTGQGSAPNVQGGLKIGNLALVLKYSDQMISHQDWALTDYQTVAFTIALDTWYKIRAVISGSTMSSYVDGVLKATTRIGGTGNNNYFGLTGYNSLIHHRNIKVWTLSTGAPA